MGAVVVAALIVHHPRKDPPMLPLTAAVISLLPFRTRSLLCSDRVLSLSGTLFEAYKSNLERKNIDEITTAGLSAYQSSYVQTAFSIKSGMSWPEIPPDLASIPDDLAFRKPWTLETAAQVYALDSTTYTLASKVASRPNEIDKKRASKLYGCDRNRMLLVHQEFDRNRYATIPYTCNLPFCPKCTRRKSIEWFKQIGSMLFARPMPQKPWAFVHLVLTIKNVPCGTLYESLRQLTDALRAFIGRKHDWFREKVLGGLFNVEITYNRRSKTYHPHVHILCEAAYIPVRDLSAKWAAFAGRRGLTASPTASAYIKRLPCGNQAMLAQSILECTKYVVKPIEAEVNQSVIFELADSLHTPRSSGVKRLRLRQLFGQWKLRPTISSSYWDLLGGVKAAISEAAKAAYPDPTILSAILSSVQQGSPEHLYLIQLCPELEYVHLASRKPDHDQQ